MNISLSGVLISIDEALKRDQRQRLEILSREIDGLDDC